MKLIGAHLSVAKGLHTVEEQMKLLGCETCAIFVKNQRRFESAPLRDEDVARFKKQVAGADKILVHGSYLINLANPESVEKNMNCLLDELNRCHILGLRLYNLHPGSDTKKLGKTETAKLIAKGLNEAMKAVPDITILLENMAGQGNTYGTTFGEIRAIIDQIDDKSRIGVTLDTCHMFVAGYDIRKKHGFRQIMEEFDKKIGIEYLKGMHLNDSQQEFNSRKDRHASIGEGHIGLEAFEYIMNSSYFDDIPLILETPVPEKYRDEIALLKSLVGK